MRFGRNAGAAVMAVRRREHEEFINTTKGTLKSVELSIRLWVGISFPFHVIECPPESRQIVIYAHRKVIGRIKKREHLWGDCLPIGVRVIYEASSHHKVKVLRDNGLGWKDLWGE